MCSRLVALKYDITAPKTIPKGSPFKKSAMILKYGGKNAKAANIANPKEIKPINQRVLLVGDISDIILIPKNLDSIYPSTWLMTIAVFGSISKLNPKSKYWPAKNDFLTAYIPV